MKQGKILIADDERAIATGLSAILEDEGYQVDVAGDGQTALDRLTSDTYGVILADLKMPKIDGIALLKEMQGREIGTECIIVTGQGTVDDAIQAMRHGAYDYIEKPLNAETPTTASVLILGESGTGKELVARAVHSKSERGKGPFFAINCAALPKDILENELFGHEKGAFTGSTNEKPGAFELAHGGTLFLDEVAEMAPDIQVKLLRSLETRAVRRLGGKKEIQFDTRVIS